MFKNKAFIAVCMLMIISSCGSKQAQIDDNDTSQIVGDSQRVMVNQDDTKNQDDFTRIDSQLTSIITSSFDEEELKYLSISIYVPSVDFTFTYNEDLEYPSASTIKVPINLYIYDLAKNNPKILQQMIQYTEIAYEDGTGIIQGHELGSFYTVQQLLNYSICYSDNIATNLLLLNFFHDGMNLKEELTPYFGDANYVDHYSSAINRMQTLKYLYEHQDAYPQLIEDMKHTEIDYLTKYLPKNIEVAHKIGTDGSTIHDYGIVYTKNPYLINLSMYSISDQEERMQQLSKKIYTALLELN